MSRLTTTSKLSPVLFPSPFKIWRKIPFNRAAAMWGGIINSMKTNSLNYLYELYSAFIKGTLLQQNHYFLFLIPYLGIILSFNVLRILVFDLKPAQTFENVPSPELTKSQTGIVEILF